jgi:hypothetical protein
MLSAVLVLVASLGASAAPTPDSLAISLFAGEVRKQGGDRVLCIEVDGKDAPSSVLSAAQSKEHLVVLASKCQRSMHGSYYRATHHDAMFLSVENFQPISEERATVNFNLYVAGLWAVFETLEVRRTGGSWVVARVLKHSEA